LSSLLSSSCPSSSLLSSSSLTPTAVWWLSGKAGYLARVRTHVGIPAMAKSFGQGYESRPVRNSFGHWGYLGQIIWIVPDTALTITGYWTTRWGERLTTIRYSLVATWVIHFC
jgi:CubicO group peptidase (beta-lactamase class C family)